MYKTYIMRYLLSLFAASSLFLSQLFVIAAVNEPTKEEMETIATRRVSNIINKYNPSDSNVKKWKSSLSPTGVWPDINMTAGCDARRANWPAAAHLLRILLLASAYVSEPNDSDLFKKINLALNYWFENDFTEPDCLESGGKSGHNCPCGTPGLWNTNWFSQIIAVPKYVGDICLVLKGHLTSSQLASCETIQARSFNTIGGPTPPSKKYTGANLLDVSSVGFSLGLLTDNVTEVQRALDYFYSGALINPVVAGDGIQADGSFMQHAGLLYNGNYGKDYIGDLLSILIETKETSVVPELEAQKAFATLMSGTEWMIIADVKLHTLLWQYSVIGRMVSFKYSSKQASGGVDIDFEKVNKSTDGWENQGTFDGIVDRLKTPSTDNANQGELVGTRYFYNADYMIHRAPNYVTTMKMYSTRTVNSECVNSQNPLGFHLSDGAIFNYLTGDEYVDTFGAWNWEMVPGTTVDAYGTPLICSKLKRKGKSDFVGGVTDGNTGITVMDYVNPINGNLAFKKTAFFFPAGYAIQVGPVTSKNTTAPLITVLDQRRRNGDIYVAGRLRNTNTTYATPASSSIWHDNIGYYFPTAEVLYVDSKPRASDWEKIGLSHGQEEQQLWTSYVKHANTSTSGLLTQYVVLPAISADDFHTQILERTVPIVLDFKTGSTLASAAYSAADRVIAVAFWTAGTYRLPWKSIKIKATQPCVLLLRKIRKNRYRVTVADPSQILTNMKLTLTRKNRSRSIHIDFPTDNLAGKGVIKTFKL
ncbi:MAG: chondroitin AC/alginate lyase [Benjaminiella poitrasii]|nr:MAG: chondroitin AC/alginate lyase [Benjaminiella poitrasii]